MTTAEATATAKATFTPPATVQHSPWHSPVPYLFGGLAAMLGLIAFALLILACSYWKLSGGEEDGERDVESGAADKGENTSDAKAFPVFEEKFLVIMAGNINPTFLATPMTSKSNSFDEKHIANDQEKIKQNENEEANEEEGESQSHVSQEQTHQ